MKSYGGNMRVFDFDNTIITDNVSIDKYLIFFITLSKDIIDSIVSDITTTSGSKFI